MEDEKIREAIKKTPSVTYPDFDLMWNKIEQNKEWQQGSKTRWFQRTNLSKTAVIAGISAVMISTPVYAAIHYNWSDVLSHKTGIQSVWEQGLGQNIDQSVNKDGITLTVDIAFSDENRTVLLYTLDPGTAYKNETVSYDKVELFNSDGEIIQGNYEQRWNAEIGKYQGYFETDYVLRHKKENLHFAITNVVLTEKTEVPLFYNPANQETQTFEIKRDGISTVRIETFEQSEKDTLLNTTVHFEGLDQRQRERTWTSFTVLDANNNMIRGSKNVYGIPGTSPDQTISEQLYTKKQLTADGTHFALSYERETGRISGEWGMDLTLSKSELENSTIREQLDLPVPELREGSKITEMIVTPSEVRLMITNQEKYAHLPFIDYELEIGGKRLTGGINYHKKPSKKTELRFEMMNMDLTSLHEQPITLTAKKRVEEHKGNEETSIRLSSISTKPQHLQTKYGEFTVDWTYYLKDEQLYVESSSQDPTFGGINQTYYYDGKEKIYGKPSIVNFRGEGTNKSMDVYENFAPDQLDIFVFMYTTEHLNEKITVPIRQNDQ
ncbi:DUF4179 domain-containing protein [Paenibacillus polygoni]|uniref:DUF4179 domain-containing protein n=1 Tax=Paenibacillus polygoni TaxID=3050112 RepID=A0ABY8XBQ5_9BACL|nr:DUF4179 domain-containing protein [Paenibacillus polygoni]WIV21548.1 DUF4179 domain-containing protein [Paenibacillus polygoni]